MLLVYVQECREHAALRNVVLRDTKMPLNSIVYIHIYADIACPVAGGRSHLQCSVLPHAAQCLPSCGSSDWPIN